MQLKLQKSLKTPFILVPTICYALNSFDLATSEIGRTGLILTINHAQIDVSDNENTLPGTQNYLSNFKGVYIEEIIIELPNFWTKDASQTANGIDIYGRNLLIGGYKENGVETSVFTGTIGLHGGAALSTTLPGGLGLSLEEFSITLDAVGVDSSSVRGELTIPLDNPVTIILTGEFENNGFSLSATGATGHLFQIPLGEFGILYFDRITIGSDQGKFFFSFGASMTYNSGFPILDKILPNPIILEEFRVSEGLLGINRGMNADVLRDGVRIKWGDAPDFLLSIGGFHPEYTPPPLKLPKMVRLGISLLNEENAKVGFELYFAVSTNSVQAGAAVYAIFTAGKFAVVVRFSFDVLFEFNPFRMIISIELRAALEYDGFPIVAILAQLRLSGPTPWNVSGTASIAIIGIEFKIDFDHTFGETIDTSVPNIALQPLVRAELEKPENWRSIFPSGSKNMVQFRAVEDSERVAAHPSGQFIVEQTIVPLNIPMDKYGQNEIADATEYKITKISSIRTGLPPQVLETRPLFNLFAAAQHFDLTEDEKLSRPSFERYVSGVVIDRTDKLFVSKAQIKEVSYEQLLVQPSIQNPNNIQKQASVVTTNKDTFENLSEGGAVGRSSLSPKNRAIRQDMTWDKNTLHYIVNNITLQVFVSSAFMPIPTALPLAEAQHLLEQIIESEPRLEDLLIIVEEYELGRLVTDTANEMVVLAM